MDLITLKKSLQKNIAEMRSLNEACLNDKGEVREFTAEENEKYSSLEKNCEQVRSAIERLEKLENSESIIGDLEEEKRQAPRVSITRENNCNDDGDYRGYKEIDKGGLGEYLKDVAQAKRSNGNLVSKKLKEMRAVLGMSESIGQDGGFLVQSDHAEDLYSNAKDAGFIASKCMEVICSSKSNSTTFNQVDETSLARGSLFGGISAAFVGEGGTISSSKPKFRQVDVKLNKLTAAAYITEEQLEDSSQLNSFVGNAFPYVMKDEIDYSVLWGNGANNLLGIFNSGALITVAKESGPQTADTIVGANINKMVDRLLNPNLGTTVFMGHPDTLAQLRTAYVALGSGTDKPVYADPGLFPGSQANLAGYPFIVSQNCKALGDLGDLLLADFSKYVIFRKSGIKAAQSSHVEFLTDQMVFKWTLRVSGMPSLNNVLTDRHGSNTRSPFITLEAR